MLTTQLKLALRNLRKYPVFSFINLGGLSVGIASSFILLVYSQREISCDRHFPDADKIYRIGTDFFNMGGFARSQSILTPLLRASCPDIRYATALDRAYEEVPVRMDTQDRAFTGIYPYYIDSSFFKVFSYQAIAGSIPQNGLAPGELILSETNAHRLFGNQDAIGKTLLIGKKNTPCTVVAILKENFERSHLDPALLLPLPPDTHDEDVRNWSSATRYNYVKLNPQGTAAGLHHWLDRLLQKVVYPASGATASFAQWKEGNMAVKFIVQPLTTIYFQSDLKFELSPGGDLIQVRLLGAISIFLILLAIINYTNLVTSRSSIRSREIGVKKAFGASRSSLIRQFLLESLLFGILAMFLACGLIQVILFIYQSTTGAPLTGPLPLLRTHYAWLFLFSICVGLLAGAYPALYLTAARPLIVLRPFSPFPAKSNPRLRNALVLLQFTIAAALIFVSLVIYSQLQFIRNKDKGFRADGVVIVENADALRENALTFQRLVAQQSQVVSTSFCNRTPAASNSIWMYSYRTPAMKQDMNLQTFPVDDQFISTLGMHLTTGRNFNKSLLSDTNSLILNESAVAALGLFNPIGATINGSEKVIGVVKDFNFASLHEKIGPVVLRFLPQGNALAIRIRGGQVSAFLSKLDQLGKALLPEGTLKISFLDDNFAKLATKEELLGKAITFFTVLAILLAMMGLIGLTLFTIERRTREIGIRKVLGANSKDIIRLISTDFIRLAALSSLIALPLGWWLVRRWLENFAYHVPISVQSFLITECIVLIIAFSIISGLTLRAAITDPVKHLRAV